MTFDNNESATTEASTLNKNSGGGTYSFKRRYKNDTLIGTGTIKFRPYTVSEPPKQPAIFTFYVLNESGRRWYNAEEGMAWKDWASSSYNRDGFFINGDKVYKTFSEQLSYDGTGSNVLSTDKVYSQDYFIMRIVPSAEELGFVGNVVVENDDPSYVEIYILKEPTVDYAQVRMQQTIEGLYNADNVVDVFYEIRDTAGEVVDLNEWLGSDSLIVYDIFSMTISGYEESFGIIGMDINLNATAYDKDEKVVVCLDVVRYDPNYDEITDEWIAIEGLGTANGAVHIENMPQEIALYIQNEATFMCIVRRNK